MTETKKRIMIVLEAMAHEFIMNSQPPNIMKYFGAENIHPAVTWGLGSRPSAGAYSGGMLPVCSIPQCYHRQIGINWCNPFFLTLMKAQTQKQFYLTSNGWTLELFLPWMTPEQRELCFKWIEMRKNTAPAKEMIDYFLKEQQGLDSYFVYFHLFETHYPFHGPDIPPHKGESIEERMKYRKDALMYVDEQIGRIFDECGSDAKIVLCSDHNLPPLIVSAANDVPSPKTFLSFIATNFTEVEKTYEGDHLEWARKVWSDIECGWKFD